MSVKIETISHEVVQASSIEQFCYPKSSRRKNYRILKMPYWIKLSDAWVFEFITNDTDVETLRHNIDQGAVYILKNHSNQIEL